MLKQQAKEKWRFNLMPFRLSAARAMQLRGLFKNHLLDASLRPRAAPRSRRATWQERDDPCASPLRQSGNRDRTARSRSRCDRCQTQWPPARRPRARDCRARPRFAPPRSLNGSRRVARAVPIAGEHQQIQIAVAQRLAAQPAHACLALNGKQLWLAVERIEIFADYRRVVENGTVVEHEGWNL